MSSISAGTTSGTALVSTGDTTGTLDLKTGAGATTALSIDASQRVGIGTSSPTAKLHTVVTDASSVLILERTGAGATSFTADFSGAVFNQSLSGGADYVWKEGGTEWMRLTNTGSVGIGTSSLTGYSLRVGKQVTGAVDSVGVLSNGLVQSDVTSSAAQLQAQIGLAASAFTLSNAFGLYVGQTALSGGAAITSQYGVYVANSLTGATNNYGFYSNIASGTNRYNFYAAGTAENYFAGNIGIGAVAGSTTGQLRIAGNGSGATNFNGITLETSIQSGVTSSWRGLLVRPTTQATAFTLSNLYGVYVNPQTFGAGSTVTNQYGFHAESTLTGATNNYGFYSNIASGTGRWNFYANGTADNYFAGNVGIGTSSPNDKLTVASDNYLSFQTSSTTFNSGRVARIGGVSVGSGNGYLSFETYQGGSGGGERMRLESDGLLQISKGTYTGFWIGDAGYKMFVTSGRLVAQNGSNGVELAFNASAWAAYSDIRAKTSLTPITDAKTKLKTARTVTGRYITDSEDVSRSFLIAQDWFEILPESVDASDPERLSLRYTETIPLIAAAVNEQTDEIAELKAIIESLTARIAALEAK